MSCRWRTALWIVVFLAAAMVGSSPAGARPPDLDGSGVIDLGDLRVFIEQWRLREGALWDEAADLNEDGRLDHADALLLVVTSPRFLDQ